MPVNAAMSSARNYLTKCEDIARNIRTRIHGPATSEAAGTISGATTPEHANWMANDISNRLDALANALSDIEVSF
jgi:hypothetical protein